MSLVTLGNSRQWREMLSNVGGKPGGNGGNSGQWQEMLSNVGGKPAGTAGR